MNSHEQYDPASLIEGLHIISDLLVAGVPGTGVKHARELDTMHNLHMESNVQHHLADDSNELQEVKIQHELIPNSAQTQAKYQLSTYSVLTQHLLSTYSVLTQYLLITSSVLAQY